MADYEFLTTWLLESPREIEHDNPSLRRPEEMADFLSQLYNRDVSGAHAVTVIRFSAIKNS